MEQYYLLFMSMLIFLVPKFRETFFPNISHNQHKLKKRDKNIDTLKGISIIAVIIIHVIYFYQRSKLIAIDPKILFLMNNMLRFAVPTFFICSGITLNPIKTKKELTNFYKRKLTRIIIPYLLVSLLIIYLENKRLNIFYLLITGKTSGPFYFLIILIQFYLLFPVLSYLSKRKDFLYLSFLFTLFTVFSGKLWSIFYIPLFPRFLFFFVYGIYIRDHFLSYKIKKENMLFWTIISISFLVFCLFYPKQYYNIRLLYGTSMFNLLYYLSSKFNLYYKLSILPYIGKITLWIYLIHFQIIGYLFNILKTITDIESLNLLIIFLISLMIILVISRLISIFYDSTSIMLRKIYLWIKE